MTNDDIDQAQLDMMTRRMTLPPDTHPMRTIDTHPTCPHTVFAKDEHDGLADKIKSEEEDA